METRQVIVHETGNVSELLIENRGDIDLFVQAGEIVKGGRQDRVLGVDLIVGKKAGRVPIPSFCVEQGRWSKRGNESEYHFSSSANYAPSKAVHMTMKVAASQGAVWESIAAEQVKLSKAVQAPVNETASASSYQLTLEHEQIQKQKEDGLAKLRPLLAQNPSAIGWGFAINGQMNNADIYASHDLFSQLWDKLSSAAITESIAETKPPGFKKPRFTVTKVSRFLERASMELKATNEVTPRVQVNQYHRPDTARFETVDRKHPGISVHTNVLSLVNY